MRSEGYSRRGRDEGIRRGARFGGRRRSEESLGLRLMIIGGLFVLAGLCEIGGGYLV